MLKVDIDLFCFKQIPTFYMKIYTPWWYKLSSFNIIAYKNILGGQLRQHGTNINMFFFIVNCMHLNLDVIMIYCAKFRIKLIKAAK